MFKTMKKSSTIFLVIALLAALTACGSKNDNATNDKSGQADAKQVKLKFYAQYSGENIQVYDAAKAAMKEKMPEVNVEFEVAAQDDDQKIKTYAAAGSLPDIFSASSGLIEVLKNSGNLMELDQVVEENHIEDLLNDITKKTLRNKDGHIYAVPEVGQWSAVIYYNKELFQKNNIKVPENYTEFLQAVNAFHSAGITPLSLFAKEKWPGVQLYDMAVVGSEPEGIKRLDNGEGDFSDEAYQGASQKISELVKAGMLSKNAFTMTWDDALAQFTSGNSAMILNGAWAMNDFYKQMGDKFGILYTPLTDADKIADHKWNVSGGGGGASGGFAVSKNSDNKEVAAKYAALFSLEYGKQRVYLLGDPNPVQIDNPEPKDGFSPIQKQYKEDAVNFKTMSVFPWGLENPKFKTSLEDNVQKLLNGQSVDGFTNDMNKALENARK